MMLLRNVRLSDLDDIFQLAKESGFGLTTLPKDKALLEKRIKWSEASFKKQVKEPEDEYYMFVLEDSITKKVVGTSAIEASLGHESPFYSYKLSNRTRICHSLDIRSDYEVLSLVNDHQGKTEICTLYLHPEYRHSGNGLLLSKSRFLFMADNSKRFASAIIAEMRGFSDKEGQSPFWDNIGANFFQIPFVEADKLTISTNKQFIADLMPRNPIYVKLLSKEAQSVIGKPHPSTVPAMRILLQEGFRYDEYVDIFDAGPTIEANLEDIKTIVSSIQIKVSKINDHVSSSRYLISNTEVDFRSIVGSIVFNKEQKTGNIDKKTAQALDINIGDTIRVVPLKIS